MKSKSNPTPPTAEWLNNLPYVQFLAFLGESNMPPGGIATISTLVHKAHIRTGTRVLHAGCNTGFLTREVSRLTSCLSTGIDIEPDMIEAARSRTKRERLEKAVTFEVADMRTMPFSGAAFDVVISGGALAFVEGHTDAVNEWIRVTKPGGRLADAEFYYHTPPPSSIRADLAHLLGVNVPEYDRGYWSTLFGQPQLAPYWIDHAAAEVRSDAEVQDYCRRMAAFVATTDWQTDSRSALERRLLETFRLFNENMKYLAYSSFVYRRMADHDEPMLYG